MNEKQSMDKNDIYKMAYYFLDIHVSGSDSHPSDGEKHLNTCIDAIVSEARVAETTGDQGFVATSITARIYCTHGWGIHFEKSLSGTADGFLSAADTLIDG